MGRSQLPRQFLEQACLNVRERVQFDSTLRVMPANSLVNAGSSGFGHS